MWGRGAYNPAHALSGLRARAEEVTCREQMINAKVSRGTVEDDPILGTPGLQWEEQSHNEGYPQTVP